MRSDEMMRSDEVVKKRPNVDIEIISDMFERGGCRDVAFRGLLAIAIESESYSCSV